MRELLKSPYSKLFLFGLLAFIIASIFSEGYHHPDEHFQILEACNYTLGNSPMSDLTWEFQDKARPALQPYLAYAIIKCLSFVGIKNPFIYSFFLRFLTALLAWFIICKLSLLLLNDFETEWGKKMFILMNLFLWFVPYLYVRFSSENISGLTLLVAIYILLLHLKNLLKNKFFSLFIIGLLLGFSFFFRFQVGFAMIGLGAWMIFVKKMKAKEIMTIFLGGLLSVSFCIYLDYLFYGTFQLTPYNYFYFNLIKDKVSAFGVNPWWFYFSLFILQAIPPLSIFLLLFFITGLYIKPTNIFSFCIIPFLIIHMLIGHKEMRFLFPLLFGFLYLAAISIDRLFVKYKLSKSLIYMFCILVFINIPLLAYRTLVPAQEAMNCYRFLYNYSENKNVTIVCRDESIYTLVEQKVNFYKPAGLNIVVLKNNDEIIKYLHETNLKNVLLFNEKLPLDTVFNSFPKKRIYCLFPEWLLKYNFNNWEARSRIWSIYEISSNKTTSPL